MPRVINFQAVAWFWDLFQRQLLDLNPPYQRRSVWNQEYKDYFIDTVLNGYPAPPIFLHQEITPSGFAKYSVVDGKQRLSTVFDFAQNFFPVGERATIERLRGKYFTELDDSTKLEFWQYVFSVEYLATSEESLISNIFDRINKNVAKLTPQELRHARFSGEFITQSEDLTEWFLETLPVNFPVMTQRARRQMKDVEFVSQLLLLIEEGIKSYSQADLDEAFNDRESIWEQKDTVIAQFRRVVEYLTTLALHNDIDLTKTRLRNQADFYSLFGAVHELLQARTNIPASEAASRLNSFARVVDDAAVREDRREVSSYYAAARFSSSDPGARRTRVDVIKAVIIGNITV